jgi:hypothetical protein
MSGKGRHSELSPRRVLSSTNKKIRVGTRSMVWVEGLHFQCRESRWKTSRRTIPPRLTRSRELKSFMSQSSTCHL